MRQIIGPPKAMISGGQGEGINIYFSLNDLAYTLLYEFGESLVVFLLLCLSSP